MTTLPRFYPILDIATLNRCGCPIAHAAEALLNAGAKILQFRHKGHYTRATLAEAEQIAALCDEAGAMFVVNDRADIAILLDAAVHIGQDDLAPADVRRLIGPARVLGYSTHNESQLLAATKEPADYLAIGPIFSTGSKENPDPVVGLEELRRLRAIVSCPLVAIGGVTLDSAPSLYAAGADSLAVIGALFAPPCTPAAIRDRAELWLHL